jgi:transcriptional regulator with XRE-family HTH domain
MKHPHPSGSSPVHTQLAAVMQHIPEYQFRGLSRLARDAGLSKATLSRLLSGKHEPSYRTVYRVTEAIERRLKRPLDPRDLIGETFAFRYTACELCGCRGCIPAEAYDANEEVISTFRGVQSGEWSAFDIQKAREGGVR